VKGPDGEVLKEVLQIIHLGSNGDPWWDSKQLIDQVKNKAIPIFEEAHPGCQALFIYDQSSAHATLAPDTLKAFKMNKSNGGAQHQQKDTVIPDSNPFPEYRGRVQKMTTETGQQKGLQQTLEDHGVHQSALSRTIIAAWHVFSVSKRILLTKFLFSKL
jgi:hypothetical protein